MFPSVRVLSIMDSRNQLDRGFQTLSLATMSRTLTPSYYFYGRPDPGELRINRPPAEVQYGGFHTHVIISSHPLLAARIFPLSFSFCLDLAHELSGRAARPHHLSLFSFPLSLFVWILPHELFQRARAAAKRRGAAMGFPGDGITGLSLIHI